MPMKSNLDKLAGVLSNTFQIVTYREAWVDWFDYEYICEAEDVNVWLEDKRWRVKRIKTIVDGDAWAYNWPLVNVVYAKLWGQATKQFVFKATDLAYCKALPYNLD